MSTYDTLFLIVMCRAFGALVVTLAAVTWYSRDRRDADRP